MSTFRLDTIIIVAVLLFFVNNKSTAQQFSEIGLGVNSFQYHGDLTDNLPVLEGFNFGGSLFYRYNFNAGIAAKAQASYGQFTANDQSSRNNFRNFNVRTTIIELSLTGQINPIALIKGDDEIGRVTPFLFAGVSGYYFNPMGRYQGKWYSLQPLGTEGQGLTEYPDKKPYNQFQVSIPFGIDIRYHLSRSSFTGFELGFRKTFTDYLEDVSGTYADNALLSDNKGEPAAYFGDPSGLNIAEGKPRGNSAKNDWYSLFNIYFTYNLISKRDWRYMKKRNFK